MYRCDDCCREFEDPARESIGYKSGTNTEVFINACPHCRSRNIHLLVEKAKEEPVDPLHLFTHMYVARELQPLLFKALMGTKEGGQPSMVIKDVHDDIVKTAHDLGLVEAVVLPEAFIDVITHEGSRMPGRTSPGLQITFTQEGIDAVLDSMGILTC